MMNALRKRPMIRPLLVWVTGILLQSFHNIGSFSFLLLVIPFGVLLFSFFYRKKNVVFAFSSRWMWGVCFFLFLLFLSIQFSQWREQYEPSTESSFVRRAALEVRDQWIDRIDGLDLAEDEKRVLATVALGYRQHLSPEVRHAFTVTGSAHILAVSGMHVGIVCGFLSFVFSLPGLSNRRNRMVLILQLLFLWGYVFITGCAASAVRAGWMLSFYLAGRLLMKNTDSYNTLAAAAFCMLVYDPFYLFDIGFQLSCLAVFFILYLTPLLRDLLPVRNPLLSVPAGWLTVACAAQAGLALICFWYFRSVTLLFLFATLPVMAMVACLMPVALVWLLMPDWLPGYSLVRLGVETLTHWFCRVVYRFSEIKGLDITFSPALWEVIAGYLLLFACIEYLRSYKKNSVKSGTFELLN